MTSTLSIHSISKRFSGRDKVAALTEFDLEVGKGEVVAILGPSGCGKSTLLRCVAGLDRPDSGVISINGTVVSDEKRWIPPERRGLGMVFQSYALWPHLTVVENLAFPLRMAGRGKAEAATTIQSALTTVGLSGKEDRLPSQLSGGQQQRVALARAIIANPKLLLFDEPLSNLDVNLREAMRIELRTLRSSLGWTGLYVTHDRAEAVHLADRIVVLREGRVQQIGIGEELYERPVNRFVAEFMGDVNAIPVTAPCLADVHGTLPDALAKADAGFIAFRPEYISIAAPSANKNGGMPGRVKMAINLGWYVEYIVVVDGAEIKVRGTSQRSYYSGDPVVVTPEPTHALHFPE